VIKIKDRLSSEQGFTLIELLVVIVILGILVAIAVPSYLSFRGNAAQAAAQANVRSAIPAAEGYYQDPTYGNGTYYHLGLAANGSMVNADLALVAPGISPSVNIESLGAGKGYCLDSTNGGKFAYYIGGAPGAAAGANPLSTVTTGATCATLVGMTTP
jgi:type IV pilus assembly protein PilA